jgi:hypothetical protein
MLSRAETRPAVWTKSYDETDTRPICAERIAVDLITTGRIFSVGT